MFERHARVTIIPIPAFLSRVFLFDLLALGLLIWLKNRLTQGSGWREGGDTVRRVKEGLRYVGRSSAVTLALGSSKVIDEGVGLVC